MTDPSANPDPNVPPPTVTVAPGGLSTGAHAVHIVASVFTLGLWLPVYGAHAALAPKRHISVTGTPEQVEAQLAAMQPVRRPVTYTRAEKLWFYWGGGALLAFVIFGVVVSTLANRGS